MPRCLIIQPIHQAGLNRLRDAGIEPVAPDAPDPSSVRAAILGVEAVVTRNAGLSAQAMDAGRSLRVIAVHGTGVDPVDVDHATELGIPVLSTPTANVVSVAEQAIALMLAVAKRAPAADRAVRRGDFDFRYRARLVELTGKTLGVVGWGRIGQAVARIARAGLGMKVVVFSPTAEPQDVTREGCEKVETLPDLVRQADVISLHLPLRPSTRRLFGPAEFESMKPGAILVNTGRGGTVDEAALIDALERGAIAGAGLDVFETETMPNSYHLLQMDNVVLSPHVGGSTEEALHRTAVQVADGVIAALRGERPAHLVNPEAWPGRCGTTAQVQSEC